MDAKTFPPRVVPTVWSLGASSLLVKPPLLLMSVSSSNICPPSRTRLPFRRTRQLSIRLTSALGTIGTKSVSFSPYRGSSPVSISYAMTPNAYTSCKGVFASPLSLSGLAYCFARSALTDFCPECPVRDAPTKSPNITVIDRDEVSTKIASGFKSRCTCPEECSS